MIKLKVKASKNYEVIITDGYLNLGEQVKKVFRGEKILIVSDDTVFPLYGRMVKEQLGAFKVCEFIVKSGEKSKNIDNFNAICEFLAENTFSRKDCVIALGGGVVGDLSGFVSASYMRGITFIQCPTTLLSAVDSSVGGKTAINLSAGKNLVGAFYQPSLVYLATDTLKSLPDREIFNGMGEIIKYAFLSKTITYESLKQKDYQTLIYNSLKIKAEIVKKDEFEGGLRAVLNLGHTIGHAVESLSDYTIPHGVAVLIGLKKIIKISAKYYGLTQEEVDKMNKVVSLYDGLLNEDSSNNLILEKIKNDKKAVGDTINAVLIKDIGKVEVVKMPLSRFGELMD